jgi:FlaA1/EpsC-like NDP-sugar epimerase
LECSLKRDKNMNVMRILRHPRAAVVVHDLVMVVFAWLAAGWIINRSGFSGVIHSLPLMTELLLVLAVQGLVLWSTGLYKGLWRFASFPDLWNIVRAATFGTILIITALTIFYGTEVRQVIGAVLIYPIASGRTRGCRKRARPPVSSARWCLAPGAPGPCWNAN